jgi:protein tyrosine phosphatase
MDNDDQNYQNKFLEFFNLEEYDNEKIMDKIKQLYEVIKDIPVFQKEMRESAARVMSDDLEMGLVMLFSYDNFSDFCSLLENNEIKLSD